MTASSRARRSADGDLIAPARSLHVPFTCANIASRLGFASERTLDAYERLFHGGDGTAFPVLIRLKPRSDREPDRRGSTTDGPR